MLKALFEKAPTPESLAKEINAVDGMLPKAAETVSKAQTEYRRTVQRQIAGVGDTTTAERARRVLEKARDEHEALAAARAELNQKLSAALADEVDEKAKDALKRRAEYSAKHQKLLLELARLAGQCAARLEAVTRPVERSGLHARVLALCVPNRFRGFERDDELNDVRKRSTSGKLDDLAMKAIKEFDEARQEVDVPDVAAEQETIELYASMDSPGPARDATIAKRRKELLNSANGDQSEKVADEHRENSEGRGGFGVQINRRPDVS